MKNGVKGKLVFRGGWGAGGWEDDRGRGGLDWGGVIDQSRCDSSKRIHKRREKNGKQASLRPCSCAKLSVTAAVLDLLSC